MPLTQGARFGSYEITGPPGAVHQMRAKSLLRRAVLNGARRRHVPRRLRASTWASPSLTRFMKDRFDEWRKARDELVESVRRYVATIR
jgi:hypothetical protein